MNESEFWQLINEAKNATERVPQVPEWLVAHLKEKPTDYIVSYKERSHELLARAYDTRLWAAAGLLFSFCSDDKFYDFRGWLIAEGKSIYERALNDPDTLAEIDTANGDYGLPMLVSMNSVADKAYREKTGGLDLGGVLPNLPKPELLNREAWDGDQSKLKDMFPKLFAKHRR